MQSFKVANQAEDFDRFCQHLRELDGLCRIAFEPIADYHRALAWRLVHEGHDVRLISSLACTRAREGIKVVLNGHGSDEMFAGYPGKYNLVSIGDAMQRLQWKKAMAGIDSMKLIYGLGRKRAAIRSLLTLQPSFIPYWQERSRMNNNPLFHPHDRHQFTRSLPLTDPRRYSGKNRLDRLLRQDFFLSSLPSWLHLEDRISMSASIEARLPFLDYRLVKFAFSLPNELKIRDGVTKDVLRQAMKSRLPESIVSSSQKIPFSGPDTYWLTTTLRPLVQSLFLDKTPLLAEFMDQNALASLIRDFLNGNPRGTNAYFMWKVFNTEMWLRTFFA